MLLLSERGAFYTYSPPTSPGLASVQVGSARIGVVKASLNVSGGDSSLGLARLCGEAFVESSGYALLDGLMRAGEVPSRPL